jgi:hypothetical protein
VPTAAGKSVSDRGNNRTPVAIAVRPSATDKNNGTTKNNPAWTQYWKKNAVSPARKIGFQIRSTRS